LNIAPQINQRDTLMTKVPQTPLVPNNTLMTATPEEGRALAITLARHTIHAMQGELEILKAGRPKYADDAFGLIAAGHVVAVEFATIAAANNYWRR
jgi:Hexameric tyrosine-coordinated heme protein (HTHP)